MKNEYQDLYITIREISDLLMLPETTVNSWFHRKSNIPPRYYDYISALNIYQQQLKEEDLRTVYTKWESDNRTFLRLQKTNELRKLKLDFEKNTLAMQKLQQKESQLLRRLHLSTYYPQFLSISLQQTENLQSWCNLLYRRSAFDLGLIKLKIQKLEEEKISLAAKIGYWESILI